MLLVFLFLLGTCAIHAAVPPGWHTNASDVLKLAAEKKQPALLYFTADWCGPCRAMAASTLKDKDVLDTLTFFHAAAVDIDLQKEVAQQYGVGAVPTFILLDDAGDELDRSSGFMDASLYRAWLAGGMARFERAQIQRAKDREQQQRLTAELQGGDPAKRDKALKELFDLCARREQSQQQFALQQLKDLAARDPQSLWPALDHSRLATRIQVANLLRAHYGEKFSFDPWAKAEARRAALAELAGKLGARP